MSGNQAVLSTPIGTITLVSGNNGLCEIRFPSEQASGDAGGRSRSAGPASNSSASNDPSRPPLTASSPEVDAAHLLLKRCLDQLAKYFDGDLREFDITLNPAGTPFQQRVWTAVREIPYGETASYGDIACRIGMPRAARAVGAANGRNPIPIIIPCHRIIGGNGSLTGYGGGLAIKEHLLALERENR